MGTYTYVILEISPAAYEEIKSALLKVGYEDALHKHTEYKVPVLDMEGLALAPLPEEEH